MGEPTTPDKLEPSNNRWLASGNRAPTLVHAVTLALAFAALMWIARRQWFFLDEWIFLTHQDVAHGGILSFNSPVSEHWETAVYFVYNGLYALVGLHSYLPYLAVGLAFHIAIVSLLWEIMVNAGVDRWTATSLALLVALFGAGWELLLWALLVANSGPIALGLLALVVAGSSLRRLRRNLIVAICLTSGLLFSQLGLLMLFPCALVISLRRGWREMLVVLTIPFLSYGLWFAAKGAAAISQSWTPSIGTIPLNVLEGLAASITAGFGLFIPGSPAAANLLPGAALGIGLMLSLRAGAPPLRARLDSEMLTPIALAASSGFFFVMVSIEHGGTATTVISRFLYVGWLMCVPLVGVGISRLVSGNTRRRVVAVMLMSAAAVSSTGLLVQTSNQYAVFSQQTQQYVLAVGSLLQSQPSSVLLADSSSIDSNFMPYVTVASVRKFLSDRALEYDVIPTAEMRALAALRLQTSFTDKPLFPYTGSKIICSLVQPNNRTSVATSSSQSIRVDSSREQALSISLVDNNGSPLASVSAEVGPAPVYLNSSLVDQALVLDGRDTFTLCQ